MCEQFNCLPRAGGLFDQDPYVMWGMRLVSEARAEKYKSEEAMRAAAAGAKSTARGRRHR